MEKHNIVTFYVREKHKSLIEEFKKIIIRDKRMSELQYTNRAGLFSVSLMQLIMNYVKQHNPEFKMQ